MVSQVQLDDLVTDDFEAVRENNLPSLVRDNVRLDWEDCGEGRFGAFEPGNKQDRKLLRFRAFVLKGGRWEFSNVTVNEAGRAPEMTAYESLPTNLTVSEIEES